MKILKISFTLFFLCVSGAALAYCPASLSGSQAIDCIINEAANEVQDDFKWEGVAVIGEEDTNRKDSDKPVTFVAIDNE